MMDKSNKSNIETLNKGGSKSFSTQCPNCNTFALQRAGAKLLNNQMQNQNLSRFGYSLFPPHQTTFLFLLWLLIGSYLYICFLPFSRCDDLNMDFTTLIRNALYRALKQGSS